jgi:hypothetical protein
MKYICIDAVFYADSNGENRFKIGWIIKILLTKNLPSLVLDKAFKQKLNLSETDSLKLVSKL